MSYMLVVGAYLLALIVYGFIISRAKVKNSEDFVVAGRRLPMIILVGTLLATWCGGGGITGSASIIYDYGPWVGVLHFLGAPIGIILLYFIAGKVRQSEKLTVPEIFQARYGTTARVLSAVCIMLAYVGIVATQVKAAGNIVSLTTGMDLNTATFIATAFIILLTVTGGMVTVAYSDAIGALVMVGGFLLAIPFLLSQAGGWDAMVEALPAVKKGLGGLTGYQIAGYMVPTIALMLGDQNMMQRFASAKDSKEAKQSNIGMFIAEVVVCALIILLSTIGIVLLPELEVTSNVIFSLAIGFLPFIFGALVLAACVSFIVTTGDSFLLSTATNLTYDVWGKFFKKDATDKQKMTFLRVTVVVLGILSAACALYFPSIITLQLTAYGMYGAAITPAFLFALFSRRVTKAGGIAGIVVGAVVTVVWNIVLAKPMGIESALLAVPASVIAIVLVSIVTRNRDDAHDIDKLYVK